MYISFILDTTIGSVGEYLVAMVVATSKRFVVGLESVLSYLAAMSRNSVVLAQ